MFHPRFGNYCADRNANGANRSAHEDHQSACVLREQAERAVVVRDALDQHAAELRRQVLDRPDAGELDPLADRLGREQRPAEPNLRPFRERELAGADDRIGEGDRILRAGEDELAGLAEAKRTRRSRHLRRDRRRHAVGPGRRRRQACRLFAHVRATGIPREACLVDPTRNRSYAAPRSEQAHLAWRTESQRNRQALRLLLIPILLQLLHVRLRTQPVPSKTNVRPEQK